MLHVYAEQFAGSARHKETSLLLEAAAEAYNLEGTTFSLDAVARRYTRFRRKHWKDVEEIRSDIAELRSERLKKNKQLDLIPFHIARSKARAQSLLEYVKRQSPFVSPRP
jgi:hypothetical protein